METSGGYIFTWLIGYSALLGPIAGILIADYFILRKSELNVAELFKTDGQYSANKGWNWAGIGALIIGILPNLPGFLHISGFVDSVPAIFDSIYAYAWFVGLAVAALVYLLIAKNSRGTSS